MSFSIRQIRYFVATAELGQISRAAVELSISQSAITTAIRDLEKTVNSQLFIRSPGGMESRISRTSPAVLLKLLNGFDVMTQRSI